MYLSELVLGNNTYKLKASNPEICFKDGDTFHFNQFNGMLGVVTTDKTKIIAYPKFDRPCKDISSITFNPSYVEVRGNGVDIQIQDSVTAVAVDISGTSSVRIVLTGNFSNLNADSLYLVLMMGTMTFSS
jgi:hypothetical protein